MKTSHVGRRPGGIRRTSYRDSCLRADPHPVGGSREPLSGTEADIEFTASFRRLLWISSGLPTTRDVSDEREGNRRPVGGPRLWHIILPATGVRLDILAIRGHTLRQPTLI